MEFCFEISSLLDLSNIDHAVSNNIHEKLIKQDLLGQVSKTVEQDCHLIKVKIQGQDLGSRFRVRIQVRIQSQKSGSGFRVSIKGQDLGSIFRIRI